MIDSSPSLTFVVLPSKEGVLRHKCIVLYKDSHEQLITHLCAHLPAWLAVVDFYCTEIFISVNMATLYRVASTVVMIKVSHVFGEEKEM